MDVTNIIKNNNRILICGKDSSGKTAFLKSVVKRLSQTENILVLSNHKEIKQESLNPQNVEYLYKPKDCSYVDMKFLNTDASYIFIDELCENIEEISEKLKDKGLVFVKTINDKLSEEDKEFFDAVIRVKLDKHGMPSVDKILK